MIMLSQLNETSPERLASDYILKANLRKQAPVKHLGDNFLSDDIDTFRDIIKESFLDKNTSGTYYRAKSTIVKSMQGSGKSTLTGILADELQSASVYSIAIVPTGLNVIHMKKHGFYAVAGKKYLAENGKGVDSNVFTKDDLHHFKIATTPDSFHKILKVMKEENCLFVVHIDEIHHTAVSVCFRKIFGELKMLSTTTNCLHIFGYTATVGPLLHLYEYDNILTYSRNQEVIEEPVITYIMDNTNSKNKAELIKRTLTTIKGKEKLFVYLSNKTQHIEVLDLLGDICNIYNVVEEKVSDSEVITKSYIKERSGNTIHISANTKGQTEIAEIIRKGEVPDSCNLVLVTSIASCGIEFTNTYNSTVLTFCSRESFNLIDEVQFSRRNRGKIKQLLLAVPNVQEYWEITDYTKYRERELTEKIKFLQHTQKMYILEKENPFGELTVAGIEDSINKSHVYERMDRLTNKYGDTKVNNVLMYYQTLSYSVDTALLEIEFDVLENIAWDSYTWNMLKNPQQFTQIYMQECEHFKFTKKPKFVEFKDVDTDPPPKKKLKDMTEEEKAEHKANAKLIKEEKVKLLNKIQNKYTIEDIVSALSNSINIVNNVELYEDLDKLKELDKAKYNSVSKKINELNTFSYKVMVWNAYLKGIGLNKIFEDFKNNEEKQKLVLEIIDDYYYKDKKGNYSRRADLRQMPKGTFVHLIVCTLDYFANQEKRIVEKKVSISSDTKYNKELIKFHNYLCKQDYYKKNEKKELSSRLATLEELIWLVFNPKNKNRISSVKKVA